MSEKKIQEEIRVVLGMTQKGFCKKFNISQGTVSGWVTGKRPISADHVNLLKEEGVSLDAIRFPYQDARPQGNKK